MTDRELLEAAAKAAGIEVTQWHEDDFGIVGHIGAGFEHWMPLEDDGDALRLLERLEIAVEVEGHKVRACGATGWVREESGADRLAAVRRAIVRAAAAMVTA